MFCMYTLCIHSQNYYAGFMYILVTFTGNKIVLLSTMTRIPFGKVLSMKMFILNCMLV